MNFLAGIGLKVWGYVAAAIAGVVAILTVLGRAKQAGRDEVTAKVNANAGETAARMAEAAAQSPKGKDDVVQDLRRGKF